MSEIVFTLMIHYGGEFVSDFGIKYVDGQTASTYIDAHMLSYFEILHEIQRIGCSNSSVIWYRIPNTDLSEGLKVISDNETIVELIEVHKDANTYVIDLYVQDDVEGNESNMEGGDRLSESLSETDSENCTDDEIDASSDFEFFAEGDRLSDYSDTENDNICKDIEGEIGEHVVDDHTGLLLTVVDDERDIQSDPEILSSPNESDNEDMGLNFPEFVENKDMKEPKMETGLIFANVTVYRKALRQFAIKRGIELSYEKNEKHRVTATCKNSCGWRIHASLYRGSTSFQIKSVKGEPHNCPRTFRNKSANSTYLANTFMENFVDDPQMSLKAFKNLVRKKVKLYSHRQQLYRAKKKALNLIHGDDKQQYYNIRGYCEMILKTNPGSTAIISVLNPPLVRNPTFHRMFILYNAQKQGFLEACRPIIGLDACFLKSSFGGQLIAAIGRDGNNQMYPLVVAVVEAENKDSWSWFLFHLTNAIGSAEEKGWVFISDRQKGLVESFQQLMPTVEHRFCVRHLYANFKLRFKDKALKNLMWAAARSYLEDEFKHNMELIKNLDPAAFAWLAKIPTELWCKHKMSPRSKCDVLCNNMSESFNNYIKEARDQPIMTMMETLRRQLMCRLQKNRKWIEKYERLICPRIQEKIDITKNKALEFEALLSGGGKWEIVSGSQAYVVDLEHHTCTCRVWDLTGIPCEHSTCAILQEHRHPEDFVSHYFLVSKYKQAYNLAIHPVPDKSQWPPVNNDPIMPPNVRRQPGRPKKARKKSADEISDGKRVTRKGGNISCSNCGATTHNKRKCNYPPGFNQVNQNNVTTQTSTRISRVSTQSNTTGNRDMEGGDNSQTGRGRGGRSRGRGSGRGMSSGSSAPRGRGRPRGTQARTERGRGRWNNGPLCGIGNWNGIGMSNMHQFIPSAEVPNTKVVDANAQPSYDKSSQVSQSSGHPKVKKINLLQVSRYKERKRDLVMPCFLPPKHPHITT